MGRKWINPGAEPTADGAMVESSPTPSLREGDHLVTLISHARRNLALSIKALPLLVTLSAALALLIAAVSGAPLSSPDSFPAGRTAVPLSSVATHANGEGSPAGEAQIRSRRTPSTWRFALSISPLCPRSLVKQPHRARPGGGEKAELQPRSANAVQKTTFSAGR
jgi:hypothetical protein